IADKGGHPRPFILSISTIRTCVWNSTRRSKPWDSLSHEAFDCKRQHVGLKKSLRGYHEELLEGHYDCVDRIVVNAYFEYAQSAGGFRSWWRALMGSDETLDRAH